MLGRRQIREKVVEAVYSYYQNPVKADVLEKNMFSQIDKIYHLYIYQLNFYGMYFSDMYELNKNIKIKIIYPLYKQGEINENYKDTIIIKTLNRKQTEISLVGIDLNKCIDYISS